MRNFSICLIICTLLLSACSPAEIINSSSLNSAGKQKLPQLLEYYYGRNINVNILLVGDSILAREYHTSYYSLEEQQRRPPLLVSKNIASLLWDRLNWNNSEYCRYDCPGAFQEIGSFVTVTTNPQNQKSHGINREIWDDFPYRPAHTRMCSGNGPASVTFTIPDGTYCANFIYRTDLNGSRCIVNIREGKGQLQVFNGKKWVEADEYKFSMRHDPPENNRGNTKFQERLKMRTCDFHQGGVFDSRSEKKTITISKVDSSDSRFMYWGSETSKFPYTLKMINSSRGSLSIGSMLKYHADDVSDWINEPETFTLVIGEIFFNEGASVFGSQHSYEKLLGRWNSYFYDTENPLSFKSMSRSGKQYWAKCEALIFNPTLSNETKGLEENEPYGWKSWKHSKDGEKSIYNNMMIYRQDFLKKYRSEQGIVFCNISQLMVDEAKVRFGRYFYRAIMPSGINGTSFLNDGCHPNDNGCRIIAQGILSALFQYNF